MTKKIEKGSFSGHETFPFRYMWLKKGIKFVAGKHAFQNDDAMFELGVGKNMVQSIKHWALLSGVIELSAPVKSQGSVLQPSALGNQLFGDKGWDPYLEDPATFWLIHWQIANSPKATTWYWAFNHMSQPEFTKQELSKWLRNLIAEQGWTAPSDNTLERDIDCFLRTYVVSRASRGGILEDSLECPLTELNLIRESDDRGHYMLQRGEQRSLPDELLVYGLLRFLSALNNSANTIPLDQVAFAPGSPGRVFCLTEDALLDRLDRLKKVTDGALVFDETAGLRQILIHNRPKPEDFLARYYKRQSVSLPQSAGLQ